MLAGHRAIQHPAHSWRKSLITVLFCALLASLSLFWASAAQARKVALVIGNSAYANTSSLTNPTNDARLIASAARQAGFEVTLVADLSNANFQRTLRDFRLVADGSEVAMIYYAGHGIEGQGKNWLIPVDAKLETDFDLPYEAINFDRVLEALAGAKVRMIVLDACRNNPFGNAWKSGVRAVPRGLGDTEIDDVLVLYAAAPGQTAADGDGGNSPFATSLARRIPEPGLPLQMLGGAVRDDVLAATGGKQRPFVSASITGTPVFLVGQPRVAPQLAVAPQPAASGGGDRSMLDALMWQGALSANTVAAFQAYLREFPSGVFSNTAQVYINRLSAQAAPVSDTRSTAPVAPQTAMVAPRATVVAAPAPNPAAAPTEAAPRLAPPPAPVSAPASQPVVVKETAKEPLPEATQGYATPQPALSTIAVSSDDSAVELPLLPNAPRFSNDNYPNCRGAFESIVGTNEKVAAINSCTVALDQYSAATLSTFRRAMIDHQKRIANLYSEQVGGKLKYSAAVQDRFFKAMTREHADSNPEGRHFAEFRSAEAKYQEDRAYMADRYCFMTGCNGYAVPVFVPGPGAVGKK
jgi:uncharacterized caspase-like protein